MHSWKSRPPKNKNMDSGRPSLQKRPETYKTMEIPSPSVENTSQKKKCILTQHFVHIHRFQKVLGLCNASWKTKTPKAKHMDVGRPSLEKRPGAYQFMKSRIRVSEIPPPQKKCILIYYFVDIDRFQKYQDWEMHFGKARPPKKKRMDIGRPSLQKRPEAHETMYIPNPVSKILPPHQKCLLT